jgi:hypothetical protein
MFYLGHCDRIFNYNVGTYYQNSRRHISEQCNLFSFEVFSQHFEHGTILENGRIND